MLLPFKFAGVGSTMVIFDLSRAFLNALAMPNMHFVPVHVGGDCNNVAGCSCLATLLLPY